VTAKVIKTVAILIGLFVLIQLVPLGRDHTNPPVVAEPKWDSPQTRELAKRACFDCHSNETVWPWYSNIAPVSWLVFRDVQVGREVMNFSEWSISPSARGERGRKEGGSEVAEVVLEGEMPPLQYMPTHPEANLSSAERQLLANGLKSLFSTTSK
jgi:hypothetical protein